MSIGHRWNSMKMDLVGRFQTRGWGVIGMVGAGDVVVTRDEGEEGDGTWWRLEGGGDGNEAAVGVREVGDNGLGMEQRRTRVERMSCRHEEVERRSRNGTWIPSETEEKAAVVMEALRWGFMGLKARGREEIAAGDNGQRMEGVRRWEAIGEEARGSEKMGFNGVDGRWILGPSHGRPAARSRFSADGGRWHRRRGSNPSQPWAWVAVVDDGDEGEMEDSSTIGCLVMA